MKQIINNKQGAFNYEILETIEAGLVLSGAEVKTIKSGRMSLKGSYVTLDHTNQAWLVGAHVPAYAPAAGHQQNYDPDHRRKLLLHKKQLDHLRGATSEKGLTIIPTSVYTKRRLIKVSIALAKGKTLVDKRQTIKRREVDRQIRRTLKQY